MSDAFAATSRFVAKAVEERLVTGVVLEPETVDAQGDIYSAEEIRFAMYSFMEAFQNVGLQHTELVNYATKVVECWVQRENTTIGGQAIKAGTWMLTVRVLSDELWAAIKSGAITGFSIGGYSQRTPVT